MSRANINVPAWGSIYGQPDESCRPVTWKIPIGYCDEMGSACAQAARQTLILERDIWSKAVSCHGAVLAMAGLVLALDAH